MQRGPSEIHRPLLGTPGPGPMYRLNLSHRICLPVNSLMMVGWFGWFIVFNVTFNNISVISCFIGGGNRNTRRKPPTCRKSLTNFIT